MEGFAEDSEDFGRKLKDFLYSVCTVEQGEGFAMVWEARGRGFWREQGGKDQG